MMIYEPDALAVVRFGLRVPAIDVEEQFLIGGRDFCALVGENSIDHHSTVPLLIRHASCSEFSH